MILSIVLHGCETWSLTLRQEHSLRVFEIRVLRKILGTEGEDVIRRYTRKMHYGEVHHLHSSTDIT
jgi:hypothetical protein